MIDRALALREAAEEADERSDRGEALRAAIEVPQFVLPEHVQQAVDAQRQRGGSSGAEAARFIEAMTWVAPEPAAIDLRAARAQLDQRCHGMDTVKDRVLDLLAASEWSRRQGQGHTGGGGKVMCLLGPPGVGKTAIAAVIAEVMGRQLQRIAMGGVDDVYLAGADQSYHHSQPGAIARRIKDSGRHPSELVFLFDEIDKVASRLHSAVPVLLALLDPEQQGKWHDHFLDTVPIDLSQTVFICTANNVDDIPPPLLDRLQPLVLPGYTRDEHIAIARAHLLPRLRKRLAIGPEVGLATEVVEALVDLSPVSPGMRQLQHQLETVMTRGLRRYLECSSNVWITADLALVWAGMAVPRDGLPRRVIGFQPGARVESAA
jgi:ATP-dependent Lon protease